MSVCGQKPINRHIKPGEMEFPGVLLCCYSGQSYHQFGPGDTNCLTTKFRLDHSGPEAEDNKVLRSLGFIDFNDLEEVGVCVYVCVSLCVCTHILVPRWPSSDEGIGGVES